MKKLVRCIVSLALVLYLVVALSFTSYLSDNEPCRGLAVVVNDSTSCKFVTVAELSRELGDLPKDVKGRPLSQIDTDSIERFLDAIDKIEHVKVVRLTDGRILIEVDPMQPVARVFDGKKSYYINRQGKRISADARYHMNVPVIVGRFADSTFTAKDVLPLVEYVTSDSTWNSLLSMIKVDSPTDVLFIPIIRGQVVNIGAPADFDSKFERLRTLYSEVLPVKGWDYYDTISVKWGGQIVATRRHKRLSQPKYDTEEDEAADDVNTMLAADGVNPGQALPGRKAKSEKPIPAARKQIKNNEVPKNKAN